jgi:serine/threonine protein phosphatase PrpC
MTNHENDYRPIPAPERQTGISPEIEQNLRSAVTPERARLIGFAATSRAEILSTGPGTSSQVTEEQIINANANDLPFAAGEMVSEERRRDYWNEEERASLHLAQKHEQWNHGMHRATLKLIGTPEGASEQQIQKAQLARETLQHLGLTGADTKEDKEFLDNNTPQSVSLYTDIEAFHHRFFGQKSDIKGFVQTIAGQCPGNDGQVDIKKLEDRLDAIKPILISFGDKSVDSLVEDYIVSYGLLTQKGQAKAVIARETKTKLNSPITQEREAVCDKLAQKQLVVEGQADQTRAGHETPGSEQTAQGQQDPDRDEPATEPQPQIQTENEGLDKKIREIEEMLSDEVGEDVHLSPEQITIIRDKELSRRLFVGAYYSIQGRLEEEGKTKSHDEIMREVERILSTATVMEQAEVITNDEAEIVFCRQPGALHIQKDKPCQDACFASQDNYKGHNYTVLAVADGHGGDVHSLSDIGSRLAVQAVQEVARRFIPGIVERMEQDNKAIDWNNDALDVFRRLFGPSVLNEWKKLVSSDFNKNQQNQTTISYNDLKKYGTTLATALIFKDWVFSAAIGDSAIYFLSKEDQTVSRILPKEGEDSLDSTQTESLCLPGARNKWATSIANIKESNLGMIFLSTDGFYDSYENPKEAIEGLYKKTNEHGIDWNKTVMPRYLYHLSEEGSADDISVIAYFPKGTEQNPS